MKNEIAEVRRRYARRTKEVDPRHYDLSSPINLLTLQERQRAILRLLKGAEIEDTGRLRLIEVGAGTGGNLLDFLRIGFAPENLAGIELLEERVAAARRILPATISIMEGDALTMAVEPASVDIVFQAVVFSSLLDDSFQERLAERMWSWVKPGGAVLWYDFVFNNPRNHDVRGVPMRRVRELFPQGLISSVLVTLAPPIARRVTFLHPALYTLLNCFPLLRTHRLCWIKKK